MARKNKPYGPCHLCGSVGPLSFEHVPPEAAFNDQRVLEADIRKIMELDRNQYSNTRGGKYNQRGAGRYSLCEKCNPDTGSWYGGHYVSFVKQVYEAPRLLSENEIAAIQVKIKPLRVLKQILVMFCSACPPDFAAKNPLLIRYLLNPTLRQFPDFISIFLAFYDVNNSNASRQSGISTRLDLSGNSVTYSEISFPPFNIVMTLNSPSPDVRLFDITWFKDYEPDADADVTLKLQNLPVNTYLPGVYHKPKPKSASE